MICRDQLSSDGNKRLYKVRTGSEGSSICAKCVVVCLSEGIEFAKMELSESKVVPRGNDWIETHRCTTDQAEVRAFRHSSEGWEYTSTKIQSSRRVEAVVASSTFGPEAEELAVTKAPSFCDFCKRKRKKTRPLVYNMKSGRSGVCAECLLVSKALLQHVGHLPQLIIRNGAMDKHGNVYSDVTLEEAAALLAPGITGKR